MGDEAHPVGASMTLLTVTVAALDPGQDQLVAPDGLGAVPDTAKLGGIVGQYLLAAFCTIAVPGELVVAVWAPQLTEDFIVDVQPHAKLDAQGLPTVSGVESIPS